MSENSHEPRVYTAEEAAATLRCGPGWLEEQARERKAPHLRLVGAQRFTSANVAAIIAMHEVLLDAGLPAAERRPAMAWMSAEAAQLLRCKPSWLQEKARRRQISSTMLGGAYHFSDAHLAEIIRIFEERPAQEASTSAARFPQSAGHAGSREATADGQASAQAARPRRRPESMTPNSAISRNQSGSVTRKPPRGRICGCPYASPGENASA